VEFYRHRQSGGLILAAMILAGCFVIGMAFLTPRADEKIFYYLIGIAALLWLAGWLFSSLLVIVDDRSVKVAFGPGLLKRRIALKDIESAATARNQWWWGWGIRAIPGGWMYNISGLDAVELRLKKGGVFRIGSDEPQRLEEALKQALQTQIN